MDAGGGRATSAPFYNLVGSGGYVVLTVASAVETLNLSGDSSSPPERRLGVHAQLHLVEVHDQQPRAFRHIRRRRASAYWQNYYDPKADYGLSGFDVRNTLNGTAVWQLPFGRGNKFGGS